MYLKEGEGARQTNRDNNIHKASWRQSGWVVVVVVRVRGCQNCRSEGGGGLILGEVGSEGINKMDKMSIGVFTEKRT